MSCAVIDWTSTDFGGGALRWSHAAVSMSACGEHTDRDGDDPGFI
jgi:hypothetical protein